MNGTGLFLLAASVAVAASVGVVFWLYRNELGRACEAARQGSLVADTGAGPIEYAEKGAGIALLSIHGAGLRAALVGRIIAEAIDLDFCKGGWPRLQRDRLEPVVQWRVEQRITDCAGDENPALLAPEQLG
jgi:hypothetical protein